MAECRYCGGEMMIADSCTFNRIVIDEETYERIRKQDEGFEESCPDCGIKKNGIHHYGCDNEDCPVCGDQLVGNCSCNIESIIDDEKPMVMNFTEKPSEEYIKMLRKMGVIQF